MLLLFVMCGICPLKILLFSMAAIYIVPYIGNRLMGKPLLVLLVISASGFFHMNYSFFSGSSNFTCKKKVHNSYANPITA